MKVWDRRSRKEEISFEHFLPVLVVVARNEKNKSIDQGKEMQMGARICRFLHGTMHRRYENLRLSDWTGTEAEKLHDQIRERGILTWWLQRKLSQKA